MFKWLKDKDICPTNYYYKYEVSDTIYAFKIIKVITEYKQKRKCNIVITKEKVVVKYSHYKTHKELEEALMFYWEDCTRLHKLELKKYYLLLQKGLKKYEEALQRCNEYELKQNPLA